jgi:sugar lactone lactonase YvrE
VEAGVTISVNGKPVPKDGKPPQFASDGIALSPDGQYLYYQALTGATLYRVKTSALRDSPSTAGSAVEKVSKTFPAAGRKTAMAGHVFPRSGRDDLYNQLPHQ